MQFTQCNKGKVGLLENDILYVDIDSAQEVGVEDLYEFCNIAAELTRKKKVFSIIDYGLYSLPTKEARELFVKRERTDYLLGRAIVVHDLGQMIIARHIEKCRKRSFPTEIFTNVNDAKDWVTQKKGEVLV